MTREPGPDIRRGRRDLEGMPGVELLDDLAWYEVVGSWALRVRLNRSGPASPLVPLSTDWFVLIGDDYPWGRLKFCPAKVGGITGTFPHQNYNGELPDRPWRTGELCLDTTAHVLGRHGLDNEPFEVSGRAGRLRWHTLRAMDWLEAAARGLMLAGDPFEVPQFPAASLSGMVVAYSEEAESFARWKAISEQYGILELAPLGAKPSLLLVTGFFSGPKKSILSQEWGQGVALGAAERGVWLRLPGAPVLDPWQAPRTWDELCKASRRSGASLDAALVKVLRHVRDGKRHVLLVGFPMPEKVGDPNCRMHWQPLLLPILCQGPQALNGFRPDFETTRYQVDRRQALAGADLKWLAGENWAPSQLVSRGSLPPAVTERRVLLIGAGALGSAIAELLVRAGVRCMMVLDGQTFEAGNLCRHTLGLPDLKGNKAEAVARRLCQSGPHAVIDAIHEDFPPTKEDDLQKVRSCDVVIDCTADDRLLHELSRFPWGTPKRFVSLSLGHGARRLFCYSAEGDAFPEDGFRDAIRPWLERERNEHEASGKSEPPREGVGCWHPVFPARTDDVWLMASAAIKQIEAVLNTGQTGAAMNVYEQQFADGVFCGVLRAKPEVGHGG